MRCRRRMAVLGRARKRQCHPEFVPGCATSPVRPIGGATTTAVPERSDRRCSRLSPRWAWQPRRVKYVLRKLFFSRRSHTGLPRLIFIVSISVRGLNRNRSRSKSPRRIGRFSSSATAVIPLKLRRCSLWPQKWCPVIKNGRLHKNSGSSHDENAGRFRRRREIVSKPLKIDHPQRPVFGISIKRGVLLEPVTITAKARQMSELTLRRHRSESMMNNGGHAASEE